MKFSIPAIISVACIIPFMLLIVSPLSLYLGNTNEIEFGLKDIVFPGIVVLSGFSFILFLVILIIRRSAYASGVLMGIITGLAAAIWVQSQLFVWDFGLFRGEEIDWNKWSFHMYAEGAIWIFLVAILVFIFVKKNSKFTNNVLLGIYLAGILSLVINAFSIPPNRNKPIGPGDSSVPELKDLFSFNPKKNVLLVILDCFQSDYFEYIVNHYPEEVNFFDGFTFYRNTSCLFPTTKASLPSIMSGSVYLNEKPFDAFIAEAYHKFNLIDAYKKKSFSSFMVGTDGTSPGVLSMKDIVDHAGKNYVNPIYLYCDLALFRALPTYFKPKIYNNGIWLLSFLQRNNYPPHNAGRDLRFLELFEKDASATDNTGIKGSFRIFHFSIPHLPLCVDENLHYDSVLKGKEGYLKQARGAVKIASRIINTLRKLGIYDNSEIVFLSDHGTMVFPQANEKITPTYMTSLVPLHVQSSSHALLLHKPVQSKGKIMINDSPLEISDVACLLGVRDGDSACNNYLHARSGGLRQRTFYLYNWENKNNWKDNYLPEMTEYYISGHVYEKASYQIGRHHYSLKGIREIQTDRKYKLGQPVLFSEGGNSDAYILPGWNNQELTHRWTNGKLAGLSFQLSQKPQRDLVLRLWGRGFAEKGSTVPEKITVRVNGKQVAYWEMLENNKFEAQIPANLVSERMINIEFAISNPKNSLNDIRQPGMAVFKLIIDEKNN